MKQTSEKEQVKIPRVRLSKETRERLVRAYIERQLAKDGNLPTERQALQTIGGSIHHILAILREYREKINSGVLL